MKLLLAKLLFSKDGRKLLWVILVPIFLLVLVVAMLFSEQSSQPPGSYTVGSKLSSAVLQYEGVVQAVLSQYGLEEHTALVLAIMMQESGGTTSLDIMQASESIGLAPNTITDPMYSIEVGVTHFNNVLEKMRKSDVDLDTAIQSYNYGLGYIDFIAKNGGAHSGELAQTFSWQEANKLGWTSYGDPAYVEHVKRYVGTMRDGQLIDVANASADFQVVYETMLQFEGYPYTFGGMNPTTSFDCSSLMMWAFREIGVNLPRTAQEQYNASKKITADELQPGDFIFFTGTYNAGRPVTHIGMYVGNGKMFDANGGGIGFSNVNDRYWQEHLYGYGRIVDFLGGEEG
ncbi:bifunctional lytic transglycosylase/C40 family peptidase [Sporosarcina limicola]|uniref:Cell wall-associated NlpC family hydrolase n=1 Tax=Sporosarcina limicola TaxID=34101 RepID=A0A927MLV0_9BACL|nr:bifunctional lytic transglycosylase/C40 family peptidase [Sporosarcina limicola]MBE1557119.1 cell wall-associated NlpC family hydrolase [Sporosarcina limicola]